jgi:hypothetical protein
VNPITHIHLDFTWGILDGQSLFQLLSSIYDEIVHWKRNIFLVPSGSAGKCFVSEVARLLQCYADASNLEIVALKACMVMQVLLLQKPSSKSKAKDHSLCLKRRLEMWKNGQVEELFQECKCLQARLSGSHPKTDDEQTARTFSNLMFRGKTKAALQFLFRKADEGVLQLDEQIEEESGTVREILEELHPNGKEPDPNILLNNRYQHSLPADPIIFDVIDGALIKKVASQCNGSGGPTGLDGHAWRRMCTSFKQASWDLCSAIAGVARRICTQCVNPDGLSALTACRLIPLNKCPGVRPIGVGEVLRRIIGKAVMRVVKRDVVEASGALQVCAGLEGGCEAAVHAMRDIFLSDDNEGILLVDAANAFNNLNRRAALHNMRFICPALATILSNTYQSPTRMFVRGGGEILSKEGTTQGDPLGMAMYALAVIPLIRKLQEAHEDTSQVWFADDATAASKCHRLRSWWDDLVKLGPSFGYYPKASKTFLVVKGEYVHIAEQAFADTEVNITTQGKRHLGAAVGSTDFRDEFVSRKVKQWCDEIELLSNVALSQPHAAFAAYVHGQASKWSYISRTIPDIGHLLEPLDKVIQEKFIPAITGRAPCSELERALLALPASLGGLNLSIPSSEAMDCFEASTKITAPIIALIAFQDADILEANRVVQVNKSSVAKEKRKNQAAKAESIYSQLSPSQQRLMECNREKGASSWVTALPIDEHGFVLHKGAFRDALCLRYGWSIQKLPLQCACGQSLSVDHAMICQKGGFPTLRHNEIRDLSANLLKEVCTNTCIEPALQPLNGETFRLATANTEDGARVDIRASGFWCTAQEAFFDVRVFHPNAPSYRSKSLGALYKQHENAKKREYSARIREVERGVFTPLVLSTAGGMARECTTFFRRLADSLASKRDVPYSTIMGWLRCRISFALLRSAIRAIRGSRSSINSFVPVDIDEVSKECAIH